MNAVRRSYDPAFAKHFATGSGRQHLLGRARETVRERFLLTRYLEQYLDLFGTFETVPAPLPSRCQFIVPWVRHELSPPAPRLEILSEAPD
jgi:hypothetical protein